MYFNKNYFTTNENIFKNIGTEGFSIYSYMLWKLDGNLILTTSIKEIKEFLTRNYDDRYSLQYNTRISKVPCLKDKETISKYLDVLLSKKIIKLINLDDLFNKSNQIDINSFSFQKVNANSLLIIELSNKYSEDIFEIQNDLFVKYINKVGHIGWSLLCSLYYEFVKFDKNKYKIYLNDFISILNRNKETIKAYLKILKIVI
jgi:hypothetical protein